MLLKQPQSMDECLYFSNRSIDNGQVKAWVYRKLCPKCKKAKMGKPVEKGKVKIRANDYVCPACGKDGEGTTPYQRKKYQGIQSYLIVCQHCQEKRPVTKKLKVV